MFSLLAVCPAPISAQYLLRLIYLTVIHAIHISAQISTRFLWAFPPPPHVSYPCRVIPVLLTVGVIFSPKSPCGLKSNLSDFTYDGLKQVSVFKALKVMWEKWTACTERTPCVSPVPVLKCTIQSCDRDGYQTCKVNCGFWKNVHEDCLSLCCAVLNCCHIFPTFACRSTILVSGFSKVKWWVTWLL